MIKRFFTVVFFMAILTVHHCFAQKVYDPEFLERIVQGEKEAADFIISFRESSATDNYNLYYMRANWEVDPAVNYIKGAITYYFQPVASPISNLIFDCSDSLLFNGFVYHGDTTDNYIRAGDNTVQLQLPQSIAMGIHDSLTLLYEGKPPATGFGSFTQDFHNDVPILFTLSEPYGASDWFPAKNSLNDKIDSIDIFVKVPAGNHVGTSGVLMDEIPVDGGQNILVHWRHRYPIATYLIGLAVTNYAIVHQNALLSSGTTVPVLQYIYPEDSAAYVSDTTLIIKFLQLYSDLFGDYPFANEKYGHAQWNFPGGEEHQTMSFVSNAGFFELIAHELGHQWFGDKITCGSWSDIWLNEGFATYLSGLAYEYIAPEYWLPFKDTQQGRAFKDSTGSVFCDDTTVVERIFSASLSYSKGAYLLHMLRWKLGDAIFFSALNNYITDVSLCYGFARTSDLKQHLETASGENLDEFFNDWFYGKGYPTYSVRWANLANGKMNIALHQSQSHPSVSFFEMPVPLLLKDAMHDTTIVIQNDANDLTYEVGPLSFEPDSIFIDPELWLLAKKKPALYDASLATLINVYPNPATDQVNISYYGNADAVNSIRIFDAAGRMMKEIQSTNSGGYYPLTVDISNLTGGYYLLEITTGSNRFVKSIAKF